MAIKHSFVSPKTDGTDATQIQPSNWNAVHSIDTPSALSGGTGIVLGTDAAGLLTLDGILATAGIQYLRRNAPNSAFEFSTAPRTFSTDYNFTFQAPAQNLSPTLKTFTLTKVPLGINGTNTLHYVGIYNNSNVFQEAVLISGGTAASGASSGTIIVSAITGTYTAGAYKIGSSSYGIQEAIWASGSYADIYIPYGTHDVYATISIPPSKQIYISGAGITGTAIRSWFASGDIIYYDASTYALGNLNNFRFDPQVTRTGGYDLHVKGIVFGSVRDIYSRNTLNAFQFENCNAIEVSGLAVSSYTGTAYYINVTSGTGGGFYHNLFAAGAATNGILVQAAAGTAFTGGVFSNIEIQSTTNGIVFYPNGGVVSETHLSNLIIDTVTTRGIWFEGGTGSGFAITVTNLRGGQTVNGYMVGIFSNWSNITLSGIKNVTAGGGVTIFGAKGISISNCVIAGLGSGVGGNVGITILDDGGAVASYIRIYDNLIGTDEIGALTGFITTVGISVTALAHNNIKIYNNTINGSSSSLAFLATGAGNAIYSNNIVGFTPTAVASAASIAIPAAYEFFTITGTTGVNAITGIPPSGTRITFITTSGAVVFTAGAGIGNTITSVQNVPLIGMSDGSKIWFNKSA